MTRRGTPTVQPLPLSKRKYLANYLGRAQGKVGRLKLIELAKQYPDKVCSLLQVTHFFPYAKILVDLVVVSIWTN